MKILWFLLLFPAWLFAQQPSYYVLGESDLEGVDIFDMLQTHDGSYILATSNGLIQFDGYRFRKIGCPDMLMNSVFNLVQDLDGNLYCNNLSGQVYRYNDEGCELLLTLADSLLSADMNLTIDDRNKLIIGSKYLVEVETDGSIRFLSQDCFFGPFEKMEDGSLEGYSTENNAFVNIKSGILRQIKRIPQSSESSRIWSRVHLGDSLYTYRANSCEVFGANGNLVFDPVNITGKPHIFKLYPTQNALWFASGSLGVLRVDENFRTANEKELFYPRSFISKVIEDSEGNVLLGTFGKGIYVIRNQATQDLTIRHLDDEIISIAASPTGKLFFGTASGKLLERDSLGNILLIRDARVKSMEALFCVGKDRLIIGEAYAMIIDLQSKSEKALSIGSVKDVEKIGAEELLIATNSGTYELNIRTKEVRQIPELHLRHYCIGFDSSTESIYAGTSKGMIIRTNDAALHPFKLRGKEVIVLDFLSVDGKMYAATSEFGVLVFKHDSLVAEWNTTSGLCSNIISQLASYDDQLVIATSQGIQLIEKTGKVLRTFDQADGLNSNKILDLEVTGNELWVVHSAGVQRLLLSYIETSTYRPKLQLKGVLVNDSIQASLKQRMFNSNQRKFSFELSAISLRYRHGISYKYRLEGAETAWRTAAYADNIIEYRSLSPGTYTFHAKAVYQNLESEEVSYTFTIATPFYKAWWFFLLTSVFAILLLVFWFRRRLNRQQRMAEQQNELNASKLTAIQSQMNPHFIFNALNSIQSLVLKGDIDNSYSYITKFANLVRRTLNYSDKEFIDLGEEIQLIELYLTLEKLRFGDDFGYQINDNGVEDVLIPPMLIQPFIENALLHGLLHRNGPKYIKLEFQLTDVLICTITDNGVGREKARFIKNRQRSQHDSFSVNAIKKRLEILQRYNKGTLGFDYEDLIQDGEATGTRVALRIPVKRKF